MTFGKTSSSANADVVPLSATAVGHSTTPGKCLDAAACTFSVPFLASPRSFANLTHMAVTWTPIARESDARVAPLFASSTADATFASKWPNHCAFWCSFCSSPIKEAIPT